MKGEDVSNFTEKLSVMITFEDQADLRLIATARGVDMQTVAREFIHAGTQRIREEYTVAKNLLLGEEIMRKQRGNK